MKLRKTSIFFLFGLVIQSFQVDLASAQNLKGFDYPELMVTPLASQRIQDEAKEERGRRFTNMLPFYAPAAVTFVSGILQTSSVDLQNDPNKYSALVGAVVGGSWLTIYTLMALTSTPYADAKAKLDSMPSKTKRDRLAKERYAEQAIYRPARLARILAWSQVITGVFANIYMLTNSEKNTVNSFLPAITIGLSALPLFFKTRWQDVANEHRRYKKRIYGPVVNGTVFYNTALNEWTPGVAASLRF